VFLFIDKDNAPYVLTKPLHHSQQLIQERENGIIIRIDVVLNFELEREILGFGEYMQVLAPRQLVTKIRQRLERASRKYEQELKTD
jgi:predicted DNA-binding transcriptional regulator YafY